MITLLIIFILCVIAFITLDTVFFLAWFMPGVLMILGIVWIIEKMINVIKKACNRHKE